jgi:hypothetical protein
MITLVLTKMENNEYKIKDSDFLGCECHVTTPYKYVNKKDIKYSLTQLSIR